MEWLHTMNIRTIPYNGNRRAGGQKTFSVAIIISLIKNRLHFHRLARLLSVLSPRDPVLHYGKVHNIRLNLLSPARYKTVPSADRFAFTFKMVLALAVRECHSHSHDKIKVRAEMIDISEYSQCGEAWPAF